MVATETCTVGKRAVCILLECFLVLEYSCLKPPEIFENIRICRPDFYQSCEIKYIVYGVYGLQATKIPIQQ